MSEFTAPARGAATHAATMLKGHTGIYATLAREHAEVLSLLEQAIEAKSGKLREQLLETIRVELLSHARAEERTLYVALSGYEHMDDMMNQHLAEHRVIEQLLRDACLAATFNAQIDAMTRLRKTIEHHVADEENEVFLEAMDVLPSGHDLVLNNRFRGQKEAEARDLEADGFDWEQGDR